MGLVLPLDGRNLFAGCSGWTSQRPQVDDTKRLHLMSLHVRIGSPWRPSAPFSVGERDRMLMG